MKFSKREYLFIGIIGLLLCVICFGIFSNFFNGDEETEEWNFAEQNDLFVMEGPMKEEKEPMIIVVDVKGAVKNPGVYQMEQGDRVVDAIEKAGGVLDEADVNQVNFAAILQDEMVVYVPMIGEEVASVINNETAIQAQGNAQGKIRINYATSEELQQIPGIGPAKAEAIIAYREENGPFQKEEDLLNVSGIGQKSFEKMKEYITVK